MFDDESLYPDEPSVALGTGNELVNPQVQTHVIEPNTQTLTLSSLLPLKQKFTETSEGEGESGSEEQHKKVMSDPRALPLTRSENVQHEVTINPSLSSQIDLEHKGTKLFLGSSSQQGDSIEQDLSHRVTIEASLPETSHDTEMINAQGGTHTQEELTKITARLAFSRFDILVLTPSSQAFKGNLETLPPTVSSSPLLENTNLAPIRDLSAANLSGEVDRQPLDYDSHDESRGTLLAGTTST